MEDGETKDLDRLLLSFIYELSLSFTLSTERKYRQRYIIIWITKKVYEEKDHIASF